MSFYKHDAKIVNKNGSYGISAFDIELIEINSEHWEEKAKPPFQIVRLLMEMIEYRLSDNLDEGNQKRLAASILQMNYFQFSDYLFEAKSVTNPRKKLTYPPKNLNDILTSEMEKDRQAQEKKVRNPISPKAHQKAFRASYHEWRKKKEFDRIGPQRIAEVKAIIQEYEGLAVDNLIFNISTEEKEIPIGQSKVGGEADMLGSDAYPIDEEGKPYMFVAQINIAEASNLLPERFPVKKGLLSFFISEHYYFWVKDRKRYEIRYYDDVGSLVRLPYPTSTIIPYQESMVEIEVSKSLPISPWPEYEKICEKLGSEVSMEEYFIQGKYENSKSSLLGYGSRIQISSIQQGSEEVIDQIHNFIPLLCLRSHYVSDAKRELIFGDLDELGFFIEPKDWENWDFSNVGFGMYS